MTKYSDLLADWLTQLGYTHCFFVAGGNIMHLLESCSRKLTCIPVVHEVAAGIAAEYFNEVNTANAQPAKAFALVTAGPGLTNILTAIAGAWLESRELLVIGGQVKTADLSRGKVRQRGIQEIDGVALASPITEKSTLMETLVGKTAFAEMIRGERGRKGPRFLEIPLDIQGTHVNPEQFPRVEEYFPAKFPAILEAVLEATVPRLKTAKRPVILLGAGIDRITSAAIYDKLITLGIPIMLTWNAADRMAADHPLYFGRPNTWGMRYSNIILQQSDLLLALGTRLSLQQTGFNWQSFVPLGDIIHVDCDVNELVKGHPHVAIPFCTDANPVLAHLADTDLGDHSEWLDFSNQVKSTLPLVEPVNNTAPGYLSPYVFVDKLSALTTAEDLVVPCSSGSAFTVMMQTYAQKLGQRIVTNKGLASMGYGLSGAIGAAFAANGQRTILIEGDGGFIQNLQELGTVHTNKLNLKIFLFDDNGYASIRMTQKNYFGGRYVGCDLATGLGIPKWDLLFAAYSIPVQSLHPGFETDPSFLEAFHAPGPQAFLVTIDPEQTYYPKITSRITASGSMESNPLHLMSPDLDAETAAKVFRYLPVS